MPSPWEKSGIFFYGEDREEIGGGRMESRLDAKIDAFTATVGAATRENQKRTSGGGGNKPLHFFDGP